MSVKVMTWVWDHSRSRKTERLVLLAIADCASEDGSNAYPSTAELMRKTGLSERGVQGAIRSLVALGELFVATNGGPRGCNRYRVIMTTPQDVPPHALRGAGNAGAQSAPPQTVPPQETTPTPANPAPGTVLEPPKKISSTKRSSKPAKPADPTEETTGQRVNRLARLYTDRVKLSNFNAVAGVVRKAVNAGVTDDLIAAGLGHLADDQRAVTVDSLRYAIYGVPPTQYRQTGPKASTTDQRVNDALALKAQMRSITSDPR